MDQLLLAIKAARMRHIDSLKLSTFEIIERTIGDSILTAKLLLCKQTDLPDSYIRALAVVRLPPCSTGLKVMFGGQAILTFANGPDESSYAAISLEQAMEDYENSVFDKGYWCWG